MPSPLRVSPTTTSDRISRWVARAGVRWGLDETTRAAFAMERFPHNTWRTGLDRILLGVAMSGDAHRHLGRGLPLDDVGSNEIDLAGRLAELVERLRTCLTGLAEARTVAEWTDRLRAGVRGLTDGRRRRLAAAAARARAGPRRGPRRTRARSSCGSPTCARCCSQIGAVGRPGELPHRDAHGLHHGPDALGPAPGRLPGRPRRRRLPQAVVVDGDDVLARRPLTGERDARSEDRQLLLDAVLAATEAPRRDLHGADEQSGARRPPAVPSGEILDAADRTTAEPVRDRILTLHPSSPTTPATSRPSDPSASTRPRCGCPLRPGPRRAAAAPGGPLPARPAEDVSLADLKGLPGAPGAGLPCASVSTSPRRFEPDDLADAIPVTLDSLEKWQIGDRLLRELLAPRPVAVMMPSSSAAPCLPAACNRR